MERGIVVTLLTISGIAVGWGASGLLRACLSILPTLAGLFLLAVLEASIIKEAWRRIKVAR